MCPASDDILSPAVISVTVGPSDPCPWTPEIILSNTLIQKELIQELRYILKSLQTGPSCSRSISAQPQFPFSYVQTHFLR